MNREHFEDQMVGKLNQVDWNFADSGTGEGIHSIHPYPAKFIPQIPRQLINLYAPEDATILDPFCGAGTSLVESLKQSHKTYGVDLHPLACLISRVKTRQLPEEFTEASRRIVRDSRARYSKENVQPPDLPNVEHWFKESVQRALTILSEEINEVEDTATREALMVAMAAIIVKVSNQDSNTRYAAVETDVDAEDVFQEFARSTSRVDEAFLKQQGWDSSLPMCRVLNEDILKVSPEDVQSEVDLIITSPPYPNAYEYWLYHKYRMYWLELGDPKEVRAKEIGARPHYHGNDPEDEEDFERQMESTFSLLGEVTHDQARACFIVGRSIIQGEEINNAEILRRAATEGRFTLEDSASREILSSSKSFNPGYSGIKNEKILVFSKEGN
jgi:site-specific DNA-methyltransferase (cytosine-N4-specific)